MQIFFLLLLFLSFLGYMFWAQAKTNWRFEILPVLVICGHVLVLYLGGLLQILPLTSIVLFTTGLGLFLYFVRVPGDKNAINAAREFPTFFYTFAVGFFLSWLLSRGKVFTYWDEFSHWALVVKTMLFTDALPTSTSSVYALSYPVGTGLFQYYVTKVLQAFQITSSFPVADEGKVYFANYLFMSMPFFILTSNSKKETAFYYGPLIFGCLFLYMLGDPGGVVGYTFYNLYVDGLLGILFGVGLILLFRSGPRYTVAELIPISMIASTLILVKQMGIILSIILMVPVAFWGLGQVRKQGIGSWFSRIKNDHAFARYSGAFLFLAALPFLCFVSWNRHVQSLGVSVTGSVNSNLSTLIEDGTQTLSSFKPSGKDAVLSLIRQVIPERDRMVVRQFVTSFRGREIGFTKLSTTKFVIIYLASILISLLCFSHNRKKWLLLNIFALAGLFLYSAVILFLYVFLFPDGANTPSLQRYVSSYLLGWGMLIFYGVFQPVASLDEVGWNKNNVFALALVTVLTLIMIVRIPNGFLNANLGILPERQQAINMAEFFGPAMAPDSRVYHLVEGPINVYHFMLRFELIPRYTQFYGWSIGRRYSKTDTFTLKYRPDEWFRLLKKEKYDYVLISRSDARFWSMYRSLFVGQSEKDVPQLFRVSDTKLIRIK